MLIVYNDPPTDDVLEYMLTKIRDTIDKNINDKNKLSEIDFYHPIKEISELDPFTNIDKVVYYIIDYILMMDEEQIYKEVEVVETILNHYKYIKSK